MAWLSTTKSVWLCENNPEDDTLNNNDAGVAIGPSYSNAVKYEGNYSLFMNNAYTGVFYWQSGLINAINATAIGYSWEAWIYDLKYSGTNQLCGRSNYPTLAGDGVVRFWLTDTDAVITWNGSIYNLGNYNRTTEGNTWINWAWSYDVVNNRLKVYKNGSLIYTLNSAGNMFTSSGKTFITGTDGNQPSYAYFDRIITNVGIVPTSFPTMPASGVSAINLMNGQTQLHIIGGGM